MMTTAAMKRREQTMEARARRAARRVGLRAVKSRRQISWENEGGFQLRNPSGNYPVRGFDYDLTAENVVTLCREEAA